jgi:hypothetical protein
LDFKKCSKWIKKIETKNEKIMILRKSVFLNHVFPNRLDFLSQFKFFRIHLEIDLILIKRID